MNTTENNKLIAEFIGEKGNDTENIKDIYIGIPVNGMKTITVEAVRMKFHISWDWLMPVVEKIENLQYINREGRFGLVSVNFEENYTTSIIDCGEGLVQEEGETKMKSIYNAVVTFIKWYNQQQK